MDVRGNISRTSNSGFLGNFPYDYTDNSSLSNITNTTLQSLRQQMDDSNHEMVNMMTQQMATIFNPVVENSKAAYQALATQMGRIAEILGVPDAGTNNAQNLNTQNNANYVRNVENIPRITPRNVIIPG
ncbi:myb-related transcription factor, partial [Trifolium medium]|nr:myb-related transcription factor [Trifolium medium]